MGWLGTWAKRIELTIDHTKVDGALSNFPVVIHLSTSSGITSGDVSAVFDELTQDANRKKIAVTTSDGETQCYVEIEKWDDANEQAWLHVKVPSVSDSADTILYLYYDSTQPDNDSYVGDTTDAVTHNVWDSDFEAVYHMSQDPNEDGADAIKDSTSNANDGTPAGSMTTADLVSGKVGDGIDFDGSNDCISIPSATSLNPQTGSFTAEAIVKTSSKAAYKYIIANREGGGGEGWQMSLEQTSGHPYAYIEAHDASTTRAEADTDISDGAYRHLVFVRDVIGGDVSFFINGTVDGTPVTDDTTATISSTINLAIGCDDEGDDFYWDDIIDEVRISSTARSAAWIKATYHSLWDSLITFGSAEGEGTLTEDVALSDSFDVQWTAGASLSEGVDLNDSIAAGHYEGALSEDVDLNDTYTAQLVSDRALTEDVDLGDTIEGIANFDMPLPSEDVELDDAFVGTNHIYSVLTESPFIFDKLGFGWIETIADGAACGDAVEIDVSYPIDEHLNMGDAVLSKWTGTLTISDTLREVGQAIVIQVFNETASDSLVCSDATSFLSQLIRTISDSLVCADTASPAITFNPTILESVAVAGVVSVLKTLYPSLSDGADLDDESLFGWDETIADGAACADTLAIAWVALHVLTDSITLTETVLNQLNVDETISDVLEYATTLAIQQSLQAVIEDTLNLSITLEMDGELWECWVLNTNSFEASVYSGYDFNSFGVYNNVAFGCKTDGVYKLSGTTDGGSAFNSGVVFPETRFSGSRNMRFRRAYFGISGSSPSLKVEDDLYGSVTYTITGSQANIQRRQKGKKWTLSLQGFDDVEFIELVPVYLTR